MGKVQAMLDTAEILGNPRPSVGLPPEEIRAFLAGQAPLVAREKNFDLIRDAVRDPNCPLDCLITWARDMLFFPAMKNSRLPVEILEEIFFGATSKVDGELSWSRWQALKNPNATRRMLMHAVTLNEETPQQHAVVHPNLPIESQVVLAQSQSDDVRTALASRADLSDEAFALLRDDQCPRVLGALIRVGRADYNLELRGVNSTLDVRYILARDTRNAEICMKLAMDPNPGVRRLVVKNIYCPAEAQVAAALNTTVEFE